MSEEKKCVIDECRKIFLELAVYWKSALTGGLILLGLILGLWSWSYAQYRDNNIEQNARIHDIEAWQNDMEYLKSDSRKILANQQEIIKAITTLNIKLDKVR